MNDQSWFNRMALIAVLTVLATAAVAAYFGHSNSTNAAAPSAAPVPATLYLTYAFNPGNGLDEVFPANFTVPSHMPVMVTITNYDNGTNPVPLANSQVAGTVGPATLRISESGTPTTYTSLPMSNIVHTFTVIKGTPVNVPIPPAQDLANPSIVSFLVYFNSSGSFQWMCLAPCDNGAMMTPGYMTGTMTVE